MARGSKGQSQSGNPINIPVPLVSASRKLTFLILAFAGGFFVTLLYSLLNQNDNLAIFWMLNISSASAGMLLGFLFGIPLRREEKKYAQNTNLEQISDWLTKILVGVTLTQIPNITTLVLNLINFIYENDEKAFIGSALIYFSIIGFMGGYLWSRLALTQDFRNADSVNEKLEQRDETDSLALSKVYLHLSGEKIDEHEKSVRETLKEVLERASSTTRINIYYQAHEIRRINSPFASQTHSSINTYRMERVISVFWALIDTYHEQDDGSKVIEPIDRYYGELGYALKDKNEPEWQEARKCFDQAINKRDNILKREPSIKWFELNRAYCWIALEKSDNKDYTEKIIQDLKDSINSNRRIRKILNDTFSIFNYVPRDLGLIDRLELNNSEISERNDIRTLIEDVNNKDRLIKLIRQKSLKNPEAMELLSWLKINKVDQELCRWLTTKAENNDQNVISTLRELANKYKNDLENVQVYLNILTH